MNQYNLTQLLDSADPNYGIMLIACYLINGDEYMTDLTTNPEPCVVPFIKTNEFLRRLKKSADITFSGVVNDSLNNQVFILSIRPDILNSLINDNNTTKFDYQKIINWLDTFSKDTAVVDIYIHPRSRTNITLLSS